MLIFLISYRKSDEAADQAAFNFLVNSVFKEKTFHGTLKNGWSCQCEIMIDPLEIRNTVDKIDDLPSIRDGYVYNEKDLPAVIVHQYNRIPNLLRKINERYENTI